MAMACDRISGFYRMDLTAVISSGVLLLKIPRLIDIIYQCILRVIYVAVSEILFK